MKIEKTKSYIRLFVGRHYITWIKKDKSKTKSGRAILKIIKVANDLNSEDLKQSIDYLEALKKIADCQG